MPVVTKTSQPKVSLTRYNKLLTSFFTIYPKRVLERFKSTL